jgi:LmbE family N-acetylglucosaminyl deacetylase
MSSDNMKKLSAILFFIFSVFIGNAQMMMSGSEISHALEKFNTLGSVLYIAAHPDDENTRMIAWLANDRKYRTAYLSLTRGDGGQNLIGDEKGARLGLIRTQELLAARRIDGGEQYFTRAVDFGYSRTAVESFEKWDKEEILRDVVHIIRQYKPDVIITRFNPDGYNGHGHHTASALLANEAFSVAADPKAYPEQVERFGAWKTKRIFLNASTWWDKELPERAKTEAGYDILNVGTYNANLGSWHNELASLSRSQHKSQGFGVSIARGSQNEYLKITGGDDFKDDFMEGVNETWSRVQGGAMIKTMMDEILYKFDPANPSKIVGALLRVKKKLNELQKDPWVLVKQKEFDRILQSCLQLYLEATTKQASAAYGDEVEFSLNAVMACDQKVIVQSMSAEGKELQIDEQLKENEKQSWSLSFTKEHKEVSHPYWLEENFKDRFVVEDRSLIGKAENDPSVVVGVKLSVDGTEMNLDIPLRYTYTTRVEGEQQRPFLWLPDFTVNISEPVLMFSGNLPKKLRVKVRAHKDGVSGKLRLYVPNSWKIEPQNVDVSFIEKGEKEFEFTVTPPFVSGTGAIRAWVEKGKEFYDRAYIEINYPHIEPQLYLPHSETKVVRLDLLNRVRKVGYIEGAGDEVAESLHQIGLNVRELDAAALGSSDLSAYECIVMGVRAYNTREELANYQEKLMDYVYDGGTLVVQYNTNRGLKVEDFGPTPLKLGRGRVTEEDAPVKFLLPDHPILKSPNEISESDFEDWVQERGLYFAQEWDADYKAILAWQDTGLDEEQGALLAQTHGKGVFVYTGISFFRQLPAGVPGAYRLFANILSFRK